MKIYLVGGAVRDQLLGLEKRSDQDFLVTGATEEDMIHAGYVKIGKKFPVFINPHTRAEYALARKEEKISAGYRGFAVTVNPQITIEEDLSRRDLTINAIAFDGKKYIDPMNGINDLHDKILRPICNNFEQDPVRVLRLARFKATFPDFSFHKSLDDQINKLHQSGELNALVLQRVRQEMEKAFLCAKPSDFFMTLKKFNVLQVIFPELIGGKGSIDTLNRLFVKKKKYLYYTVLLAVAAGNHFQRINFLKRFQIKQDQAFILKVALLYDQGFRLYSPIDIINCIKDLHIKNKNDPVLDDLRLVIHTCSGQKTAENFISFLMQCLDILTQIPIADLIQKHKPQDIKSFVRTCYEQALKPLTQFQS